MATSAMMASMIPYRVALVLKNPMGISESQALWVNSEMDIKPWKPATRNMTMPAKVTIPGRCSFDMCDFLLLSGRNRVLVLTTARS